MKDYIKSEDYFAIYVYANDGARILNDVATSLSVALAKARKSGYNNWQIERTTFYTNLPF